MTAGWWGLAVSCLVAAFGVFAVIYTSEKRRDLSNLAARNIEADCTLGAGAGRGGDRVTRRDQQA
jgi:hypothetical protein